MQERIERIAELAEPYAHKAGHCLYHLAAVVLKGGKPIGYGWNTRTRHAEVNAILNATRSVRGCDMLVLRSTPTGYAMSKPCEDCQRFIKQAGIRKVYYSTRDGFGTWKVKRGVFIESV